MGFYTKNGSRIGKVNATSLFSGSLGKFDTTEHQLIVSGGGAIATVPTASMALTPSATSHGTTSVWKDEITPANSYTDGATRTTVNGYTSSIFGSATASSLTIATPYSFVNTFTVELWAYPTLTHEIDTEASTNYPGTSGQKYIIRPNHEAANGGFGLSFGTNGISVYEHGDSYMPALLVYQSTFPTTSFTHIVVVYNNKTPTLYVNGLFARTGLTSPRPNVYCRLQEFGGAYISSYQYGKFEGGMIQAQAWNTALNAGQVTTLYNSKKNVYNV